MSPRRIVRLLEIKSSPTTDKIVWPCSAGLGYVILFLGLFFFVPFGQPKSFCYFDGNAVDVRFEFAEVLLWAITGFFLAIVGVLKSHFSRVAKLSALLAAMQMTTGSLFIRFNVMFGIVRSSDLHGTGVPLITFRWLGGIELPPTSVEMFLLISTAALIWLFISPARLLPDLGSKRRVVVLAANAIGGWFYLVSRFEFMYCPYLAVNSPDVYRTIDRGALFVQTMVMGLYYGIMTWAVGAAVALALRSLGILVARSGLVRRFTVEIRMRVTSALPVVAQITKVALLGYLIAAAMFYVASLLLRVEFLVFLRGSLLTYLLSGIPLSGASLAIWSYLRRRKAEIEE